MADISKIALSSGDTYDINAAKVNGHTVEKNVPSDAVFTDTTDLASMTGTLDIKHGGTGATTASAARTALGLGTAATRTAAASVKNNSNLPTGAAVQTYVTGLGYEANQNAFSNVAVGTTTVEADTETDTLTLVAGSNVSLTPDVANKMITVAATDTTYTSKAAASGGTAVSLVTTGEKYTWNNKTSNTGTVTKVTAGTGLSVGTTAGGNFTTSGTLNHTNSVTAQTTQALYPIKIDAQGHISAYGTAVSAASAKPEMDGTAAVGTSTKYAREDHVHPTDTSRAPTSHASTATTYGLGTDSNYGHVKLVDGFSGSSYANGNALSSHAGYLLNQNKVDKYDGIMYASIGTNSDATAYPRAAIGQSGASSGNSFIVVYYPDQSGTPSAWDLVDKDGHFIPSKAPISHASSDTTYGGATASVYGHAKVLNNLTTSSHTSGNALSAYQGYVLKQAVDGKVAQGDSYTPAKTTATYNGLTITFVRAMGTVHVTMRGTLTAEIASQSGYVTLSAIPTGFGLSSQEYSLWYTVLGALYYGQFRINSGNLQIGYTRKIADAITSNIPSGTSLYARISYACDTV